MFLDEAGKFSARHSIWVVAKPRICCLLGQLCPGNPQRLHGPQNSRQKIPKADLQQLIACLEQQLCRGLTDTKQPKLCWRAWYAILACRHLAARSGVCSPRRAVSPTECLIALNFAEHAELLPFSRLFLLSNVLLVLHTKPRGCNFRQHD